MVSLYPISLYSTAVITVKNATQDLQMFRQSLHLVVEGAFNQPHTCRRARTKTMHVQIYIFVFLVRVLRQYFEFLTHPPSQHPGNSMKSSNVLPITVECWAGQHPMSAVMSTYGVVTWR